VAILRPGLLRFACVSRRAREQQHSNEAQDCDPHDITSESPTHLPMHYHPTAPTVPLPLRGLSDRRGQEGAPEAARSTCATASTSIAKRRSARATTPSSEHAGSLPGANRERMARPITGTFASS